MTAIQLSGLQKLVQSLITTKGDCLGVKEGFGVFLNSYFLYKYMKYKMRMYPRCILSCQNMFVFYFSGINIDEFSTVKYYWF